MSIIWQIRSEEISQERESSQSKHKFLTINQKQQQRESRKSKNKLFFPLQLVSFEVMAREFHKSILKDAVVFRTVVLKFFCLDIFVSFCVRYTQQKSKIFLGFICNFPPSLSVNSDRSSLALHWLVICTCNVSFIEKINKGEKCSDMRMRYSVLTPIFTILFCFTWF